MKPDKLGCLHPIPIPSTNRFEHSKPFYAAKPAVAKPAAAKSAVAKPEEANAE